MNILLAGVAIALAAALVAFIAVKRNASEQPLQVKAVLFGLYFWGLVFFQLIVFGLGYYWTKH